MDNEFIYTIIALDFKKEVIESIINQDIGFKDNIQLIVLNNGDKYQHLYPDNILILSSLPDLKNHVKGDYIHFTNCKNIFKKDFFKNLSNLATKDIVKVDKNLKEGIYDIEKDFKHHFLDINSTFISSKFINDFDVNLDLFINKSLFHIKEYQIVSLEISDDDSICISDKMELYNTFKDTKDKFIQYAIVKDLTDLILIYDCDNKYKDEISDILQCIDENIIKKHDRIDNNVKKFLIYLKTNDFHHEIKKEKLYLKTGNTVVNGLHGHRISLDIVDIINGNLNISGLFKSSCHPDFIDFEAIINYQEGSCEIFKASKYEYLKTGRGRTNYLGIDWIFSVCFDFKIPLKNKNNFKLDIVIRFHQENDEMVLHPKINLNKNCYISQYCNYIAKKSKIILFRDNYIHVVNDSFLFKARLEFNLLLNVIKSCEDNSFYSIFIRILYYLLYPFWANRRIWLFIDRPLVADDNAKHLFSYAVKQNDGIKKYFLLNKNSKDFNKIKKISKNVVELDSLKHKLLYAYAEKFISSQTAKTFSNPYITLNFKLFSNLGTAERVFLQHGIIIHDVSHWIIKYYYNFVLFVTSAKKEKESLIYPNTNYKDDVLKLLGLPRYDGLSNDELKKQILFMPTWRKNINDEKTFLNSDYYKMLNSFLHNNELLDFLNKNGFKIMFKPHYEVINYAHLLNLPKEVELCEDVPYQELFNKSLLLITDYSSVFFDFAYLKKPIIYFRGDNEYHNKEGYFDFETMGFGDVINSEPILIDKIKEYYENNFKMEDIYLKRVDKFYKYTDKNNCKRVYDFLYGIK